MELINIAVEFWIWKKKFLYNRDIQFDIMRKKLINYLYIVVIILLIGTSLRLYDLNRKSISLDESFSIYHAQKPLIDNIKVTITDNHPPFYQILLHYWVCLFGISDFSTRLLSVLFGVLSIFILYLLASLMFNQKVGIYSALILALSIFHIQFSQYARNYSLFVFLTLVSCFFYFKYTLTRKKSYVVGYLISTILLLYTHYFALFVILFQNIHFFLQNLIKFDKIKKWILIQLVIIIFYIPLLLIFINRFYEVSSFFWIQKPTLFYFLYTFYTLAGGIFILSLFVILAIIILLKHKKIKLKNKNFYKILFLLLWLLIPLITTYIFSLFFTSLYLPRYLIPFSIPFFILFSLFLVRLKKIPQFIVIIIFLWLSFGNLYYLYYETHSEQEWRDAAAYIKKDIGEDDIILINAPYTNKPFSYYYDPVCFKSDLDACLSTKNIYGVENANRLPNKLKDVKGIWLILSHSNFVDKEGSLLKYFNQNYDLSDSKEYLGIKIYHFRPV